MGKFNNRANGSVTSSPKSAITTTGPATTFEGGTAYARDAKSDLFLLAVTNMVGEDTFYEKAGTRDDRFAALVRQVTLEDPGWMFRFIYWLRHSANMRSASIVAAAEAALVRREAKVSGLFPVQLKELNGDALMRGTRHLVSAAMARADEPGEFVAYWAQRTGKKTMPGGVQRGVADAMVELFDQYSYLKYGRPDKGFRLGDLVDLVHPRIDEDWQGDLWKHALNERHKRNEPIPESLVMLRRHKEIMEMPQEARRAFLGTTTAIDRLKAAGITWEQLSGWVGGALDAKFWESVIPSMGYMALLRNLRNFEKAGISKAVRKAVQERLSDPEQVRRSRQFPYRFLSAYRAAQSDWWAETLSDALDASAANLPVFRGKTLVLVDTSASMESLVSAKSVIRHVDVGALFGVALATAGQQVDLHGFAGGSSYYRNSSGRVQFRHELPQGGSILRGVESFTRRVGEVGHGTEITKAFRESYDGHDRIILVSDMQSFGSYDGDISTMVPKNVRVYGINTSGYAATVVDSSKPNRFEIGGFSDAIFRMIELIENGDGGWPF